MTVPFFDSYQPSAISVRLRADGRMRYAPTDCRPLIKRCLYDACRVRLAAHVHGKLCANGAEFRWHIGQGNALTQRGREGAAGHVSDLAALREDGVMRPRDSAVQHLQADQATPHALDALPEKCAAATEVGPVELDEPLQACLQRRCRLVDVIAVERQSGLQPQGIARAEANGHEAMLAPTFQQEAPEVDGLGAVGDVARERTERAQLAQGVYHQRLQNLLGAGALESKQGRGVAAVLDVDVGRNTQAIGRAADPVDVFGNVRGIDHEQVMRGGVAEVIDNEVVHDAAVVVAHGRVEGSVDGQSGDVVGQQVLHELGRGGARDVYLAHVREIKQTGGGARGSVLLDNARVPFGHLPLAEWDHARTHGTVLVVERGVLHVASLLWVGSRQYAVDR